MNKQLINDSQALRMFFDDDLYLSKKEMKKQLENENKASLQVEEVQKMTVAESVTTSNTKVDFVFKGQNERKILILVNDESHEVSNEAGAELLRKLLIAINLKGKDFALLNYAKYKKTSYKTLVDFFESKIVLAFGVDEQQLEIETKVKNTIAVEQNTKAIFTSNLVDLVSNNAEKALLWTSLKALNL